MRELKFRVWDVETKRFFKTDYNEHLSVAISVDGKTLYQNYVGGDKEIGKDVIIQQFTGLTDKNGVEIYEGDIVQQRHFDGWFDTEGFIFKGEVEFVSIKDDFDSYIADWKVGRFFNLKSDCEVIGNIYENPELLKQ